MQMPKRQGQCDRILALLRSKPYVTLPEILNLRIASHTRRIQELRKAGYVIEIELTHINGEVHSAYKLLGEPCP